MTSDSCDSLQPISCNLSAHRVRPFELGEERIGDAEH